MPRAGLTGDVVVLAAGLADEIKFRGVTMGLLVVRAPVPCASTSAAWLRCSTA